MASKRGRLNGNQSRVVKMALIKRDGAKCWICRDRLKAEQLIVENPLNDGDHTQIEQLKLACESCNGRKNSRGKSRANPSRGMMIEDLLRPKTMTAEMRKNEECEPAFRRFIIGLIEDHGEMPLKETRNAGAEEVGCALDTAQRYLDKMTSFTGQLRVYTNKDAIVMLTFRDPTRIKASENTSPDDGNI